jgi:putative phage-type endonuclease
MSAILGVNPWKSAWDLWAEKRGIVADKPAGEAAEDGNDAEPLVLKWAEKQLGPMTPNVFAELPGLRLGSNCDAVLKASGEPVEAKTSGFNGPAYGQWGEDGSDAVPDMFIVQAHVQMMCLKTPTTCHLAAWLGGIGKRLYVIELKQSLADMIAAAALGFWKSVESDTPPIDSKPSLDVLKRIRREPSRVATIPFKLFAEWDDAKEAAKIAKEKEEAAKAAIIAHDPKAEAFDYGSAERQFTFYNQRRAGYTVAPTEFRVLRLSKKA